MKKNKSSKTNKKVINLFDIPENQYKLRATITSLFGSQNQGTTFVRIGNIKICIGGKWLKLQHSRELGICLDENSLKNLNLKKGDIVEWDAKLVDDYHQFGGIQTKDGYAVRVPYCFSPGFLPLDYKGEITIRIGETIYLRQTNEQKYRYYLIKLDRKSFDREMDKILAPAFLEPSETNDGYFRHVEEISFNDKRFVVSGEYKKISSTENLCEV